MELPFPSLLGNRNSSHLKVLPTNPSVVLSAEELRNNRIAVHPTIRSATAEDKSYNIDLTLEDIHGPEVMWPMYVLKVKSTII